jgi:hypothetical protein
LAQQHVSRGIAIGDCRRRGAHDDEQRGDRHLREPGHRRIMLSADVAQQRSKRQSRKRRSRGSAPRAVVATRREERAERREDARREVRRGNRQLGREGERPESPFGGLPVSEAAILIGFIGLVIGFIRGGGPVIVVSLIVCGLGVLEVTAREHFSGYRSHTILLAAVAAVAIVAGLAAIFGAPGQRDLELVFVVPLFAVFFWLLRRRFMAARQARVARPPSP